MTRLEAQGKGGPWSPGIVAGCTTLTAVPAPVRCHSDETLGESTLDKPILGAYNLIDENNS
jgi:hypothetical protein